MLAKLPRKNWTVASGGPTTKQESLEALPGEHEDIMTDTQQDTLEQEKNPRNLDDIKKHMKDGEGPEEG